MVAVSHLDRPMYLLGYVAKEERAFLVDKSYSITSYRLLQSVLSYQTAVVRRDFDTANTIISQVPASEYPVIAKFLESQGFREEALAVTTDPEHRFNLAMDLGRLDIAYAQLSEATIAASAAANGGASATEAAGEGGAGSSQTTAVVADDDVDTLSKWRRLGDAALRSGDIRLMKECAVKAKDLSGLLLLHSAAGDKVGMMELHRLAKAAGRFNIAFVAAFVCGQVEACIDILVESNRIPEAALFARAYLPSRVPSLTKLWKDMLSAPSTSTTSVGGGLLSSSAVAANNVASMTNKRAAEALADPSAHPNLFGGAAGDWEVALMVERLFLQQRDGEGGSLPASMYEAARPQLDLNLIELVKQEGARVPPPPLPLPLSPLLMIRGQRCCMSHLQHHPQASHHPHHHPGHPPHLQWQPHPFHPLNEEV